MIIYSLAAGGKVSIGALILAGVVPAVMLAVCILVAAYLVAVKRGYPAGMFPGLGCRVAFAAAAIPGLFVAVIIIVGILSGVFTATESASIAVLYAMLVTIVVYRTMSRENFLKAAAKAVKTTGVVLLLIGVSATFEYLIGLYQVADLTGESMATVSSDPWVIFLLVNLILFVLGTFLDMASTILICTPIFLPIAVAVRHGPGAVRHGDADQLRARPQHAAGRHDAVRRLRDRRGLGRLRDAHDLAVLRRADRGAARRDLRARRSRCGCPGSSATSSGRRRRIDRRGGRR